MKILIALLLFCLLFSACAPVATPMPTPTPLPTIAPELQYFGQTPPGVNPRLFAPNVVSGELHSAPVFTPDGGELYWANEYLTQKIHTMKLIDGVWSDTGFLSLSPDITSYRDPFISPDGSRLFFLSEEPIPGITGESKENIWVANRQGGVWTEPVPLPQTVNNLPLHWCISTTSSGDLYFAAGGGGINDVYLSRYVDGEYVTAEPLGAPVNTSTNFELTPAIAPDGSYLIFARLLDSYSTPRLYITYPVDGGWSEPALIANIPYALCPMVSPDGKYLVYLSSSMSVSWRDTSFINELKPE